MDNRVWSVVPKYLHVIILFLLVFHGSTEARTSPGPRGSLQIPFIANEGQLDRKVAFYTGIPGGTLYVTVDGRIVYAMEGKEGAVLREDLGGDAHNGVEGIAAGEADVNFYEGSDPSHWRESVKTWKRVSLGRIHEHINVTLAAEEGTVEKVFTVYPGGNVSDIRGRIAGAKSLQIEKDGALHVQAPGGTIFFSPPSAYQVLDGRRHEVKVSYSVYGNGYGFTVGDYDQTQPLKIDPLLASTYMGGKSNENTYALETSGSDIILAGTADSGDFPGAEGMIDAMGDAFVIRLDQDLSTVRAATFFGGSMTDGVRALAAGPEGIYAAGYNNSPNFPTTHGAAYSGTTVSGAFVVRLDPATLRVTASTALPPNVFGLAWSRSEGTIFVAGSTGDTGFPLPAGNSQAFQITHRGGADSFVIALDEDLTAIRGATLLGGEGFDIIYDLAVDEWGYPVVAGVTNSAAFPASENAYGPSYNLDWEASHQWIDGFVARLSPDLGRLESATYLGGGRNDNISALAVQGSLILVGGSTASSDFPCGSTFGPVDGSDAFVALFNEDLSELKSCSVFGGSRSGTDSPESVSDVAFHPTGSIYAVGRTNAEDFPTTPGSYLPAPLGSYFGSFITSFAGDMSRVEASTLIHGGGEDLKALAFDAWGDVIVAGDSTGDGYPVSEGAIQPDNAGGDDLVISRFTPDLTGPHIEVWPDVLELEAHGTVTTAKGEVTLYNTGGSELTITDIAMLPGSSDALSVEGPCLYIPAFGSCVVEVVLDADLPGMKKGVLEIRSNDPFRNPLSVEILGRVVMGSADVGSADPGASQAVDSPPRLKITPDQCDFGEVETGQSLTRTIGITNMGNTDLLLGRVTLEQTGNRPFRIVGDSCSGVVLKNGRNGGQAYPFCAVRVEFSPDDAGIAAGRLIVSPKDPHGAVRTVSLTGAGIDPGSRSYPGFWGWVGILVIVLRMVLGLPVGARGWGRWMGKK